MTHTPPAHAVACTSALKAVQLFDDLPGSAVVSITSACIVASRSRSSLYRDFAAGKLTPVKIGSSTRIRVDELRLMMAGGAQ